MGVREQPVTNRMKYGRLRRYKCRVCGRTFKDYYLPEEKRVCTRCTANELGRGLPENSTQTFAEGES